VSALPGGRSQASLAWRAVVGHLWFGFWFFVAIPWMLLAWRGSDLAPALDVPGWVGIAGFAVAQLAIFAQVASFVAAGGTQMPFDPPASLIERGVYGRMRNPMYASYGVTIACVALAYREGPLVAYACGFLLLAHAYVVCIEERSLRRRFGADYESYCERTGRWWPSSRERRPIR
jgi:protein-S-isoprenylcysteine O-methyltransferase Ste14